MTATTEPTRVNAGDTLTWRKALADFPASAGWALVYVLLSAANRISIAATGDGADHVVNVPAATSAGYVAGVYTWVATVSRAGERHTVAQGSLQVLPDLSASSTTTFDARTSARKALDAVNKALESYGNKAYLQEFEVQGRRQRFHTPTEFLAMRSKLQAEVAREDAAARLGAGAMGGNLVGVRFTTR